MAELLPIKELGDEAPLYDRPWVEPSAAKPRAPTRGRRRRPDARRRAGKADRLARPVLAALGLGAVRSTSFGNTVQRPAAMPRSCACRTARRARALTCDVTPRYCEADPFEGGKQAVAECWRNITAVGARRSRSPTTSISAIRAPEIMGQFVGCMKGIGEACRALDFPVVSGNVSLYNETNGRGILPTPTIGGVGLLDDFTKSATLAFKAAGEAILLIGETRAGSASRLISRRSAAARKARRRRSISPPRSATAISCAA
jgi:phosphoribosylformylglycinamidine (FGAM) synthase-like enzyme